MDDADQRHGGLVKIYTAGSLGEAHTAALFLEARDIPAMVPEDPFNTMPRVFVPEEFEEKARKALSEMEQISHLAAEQAIPSSGEEEEADLAWKSWPRCPNCSRRRTVECPECGEAGDDFPLSENADEKGTGDVPPVRSDSPLLKCTCCTGVFLPLYRNRCEGCGHLFADAVAAPVETPTWIYLGGFVLLLLTALAIVRLMVGLGMLN